MPNPRKHEISRLEELSDAVFGFALTLLVLPTSAFLERLAPQPAAAPQVT